MESSPAPSQLAAGRNRAIRHAVLTSILSKSGTLILRLVSIPIAIRVLGMEEFGVYAAITMAVGMIDMLHVGIGPALTQGIARALARGDREREQGYFATALLLSAVLTVAGALALALLLVILPVAVLFGGDFAPYADSMKRACWIAIAILTVQFICVVAEKARDGYLETSYNNAWGAAGNFVGAAALLAGVKFFPTIEFLVLAINGSVALAKLANTAHLLVQRPYLAPRLSRWRRALVKPLLFDGAKFSVTYLLSALVEYNAIAYLIGRISGPHAVGLYNIMITVHFSLTGIIGMITIPLWPAIVDAHSRGDRPWIRKAAGRLLLLGPAFGLAALAGMVVAGPWVFPLWVGEEFSLGRGALATFGIYFTLHLWRVVNQVLLLGLGEVDFTVRTIAVESLLVLVAVVAALRLGADLAVIYAVMACCLIAVTAWSFPRRYRRAMDAMEEPSPPAEPKPAPAALAAGPSDRPLPSRAMEMAERAGAAS